MFTLEKMIRIIGGDHWRGITHAVILAVDSSCEYSDGYVPQTLAAIHGAYESGGACGISGFMYHSEMIDFFNDFAHLIFIAYAFSGNETITLKAFVERHGIHIQSYLAQFALEFVAGLTHDAIGRGDLVFTGNRIDLPEEKAA